MFSFGLKSFCVTGLTTLALSLVLYLVSRLCLLKTYPKTTASDKAIIKEKFMIDYLSYTSFVLLKPENSNLHLMRSLWRTSMSGLLIIITLTWGGFLIYEFYMTKLLSSLTLPYYEKPIKDIPGKLKLVTFPIFQRNKNQFCL